MINSAHLDIGHLEIHIVVYIIPGEALIKRLFTNYVVLMLLSKVREMALFSKLNKNSSIRSRVTE